MAAGPHASVEVVNNSISGRAEVRLTIDLPFELQSMADAQLDVGSTCVRLRGPDPASEEVCAPLPNGFVLDAEEAAAKYSKKKRQLTITSPHKQVATMAADATKSPPASLCVATPKVQAAPAALVAESRAAPVAAAAMEATRPTATAATPATELRPPAAKAASPPAQDDDDDDDDMPPPLEASRSAPCKPASDIASGLREAASSDLAPESLPAAEETNEAATALMEKALAVREQKRKETEEARRQASGAGLKKGFFSSGKGKAPKSEKAKEPEDIPFITGSVDPEAARKESLKLPEVQKAMFLQQSQKLKEDTNWVTPQLMQALASRPDLSKAMGDPKIQEAMQLMQSDPDAAKLRYKNDPDVTKFMKEFTGLMATHFEVLSNQAPNPQQSSPASSTATTAPPAQAQKAIHAPLAGLDLGAKPAPAVAAPASKGGMLPTDDPKLLALLQDPEVMHLIAGIRAGQPFEMHELGRRNERLFQKVRVLLDNGLLAMQV